jgi:hypothetical protein
VPKERTTPEAAAAAYGVGKIVRHLFVCTGPDCTTPERGEETWQYVKKRMKELNIAGPDGPAYRTRWFIPRARGIGTSRRRTPSASSRST